MIFPPLNVSFNTAVASFGGMYSPGLTGSTQNISSNIDNLPNGSLGNGGSLDQGGGGGGFNGGNGPSVPNPGAPGGPSGNGPSNYIGGSNVINTCRKTIVISWSDIDDDDEPPHYSIEVFDSGTGSGTNGVLTAPMSSSVHNSCLGGSTICDVFHLLGLPCPPLI